MPDEVPPDNAVDIPTLFFERLKDDCGNLIYLCSKLSRQINEQNLQDVFTALDAIEDRTKGMRNISIIFDGYLDKREQLMKSLNPDPEEGV